MGCVVLCCAVLKEEHSLQIKEFFHFYFYNSIINSLKKKKSRNAAFDYDFKTLLSATSNAIKYLTHSTIPTIKFQNIHIFEEIHLEKSTVNQLCWPV